MRCVEEVIFNQASESGKAPSTRRKQTWGIDSPGLIHDRTCFHFFIARLITRLEFAPPNPQDIPFAFNTYIVHIQTSIINPDSNSRPHHPLFRYISYGRLVEALPPSPAASLVAAVVVVPAGIHLPLAVPVAFCVMDGMSKELLKANSR